MKSVLLVDDEYYIRVRVRKCVDWTALGFGTVLDCESAQEALVLLGERHIDLVVLDISMPVMDGLMLCREIRAQGHNVQIIILTGYDKFEYAKSALSYEVLEYILKPIDSEELVQAVRKACGRIDQASALQCQSRQLELDLFFSTVLTDSFLCRPDMEKRLPAMGIEADKRYRLAYHRAAADSRNILQTPADWNAVEIHLPRGVFWVLPEEALDQAKAWLAEYPPETAADCFGISVSHPGTARELHMAYKEVLLISCQKLFHTKEQVFCYDNYLCDRKIHGVEQLKEYTALLHSGLREQNPVQIRQALDFAFICLAEQKNSVFGLHLFLENFLLEIQKATLNMNGEWIENALFKMQAFELINSSGDLPQLEQQLIEIAERCLKQKNYIAASAGSLMVDKIQQMIERNYMDPNLGLGSIAQALSLNASYLSDAYKRLTGQNLSQTITQTRMETARELLAEGLSLVEVMEQTGYTDPYYFSKRFKKFYGVSPSSCKTG